MGVKEEQDAGLTLQEENNRAMLECIDRFHGEVEIRSRAINEIAALFESISPNSLIVASEDALKDLIERLTSFYDDVSTQDLLIEIPRLRRQSNGHRFYHLLLSGIL